MLKRCWASTILILHALLINDALRAWSVRLFKGLDFISSEVIEFFDNNVFSKLRGTIAAGCFLWGILALGPSFWEKNWNSVKEKQSQFSTLALCIFLFLCIFLLWSHKSSSGKTSTFHFWRRHFWEKGSNDASLALIKRETFYSSNFRQIFSILQEKETQVHFKDRWTDQWKNVLPLFS